MSDSQLCNYQWNPGAWPYTTRCIRDSGHTGSHIDKHSHGCKNTTAFHPDSPILFSQRSVWSRQGEGRYVLQVGLYLIYVNAGTGAPWTAAVHYYGEDKTSIWEYEGKDFDEVARKALTRVSAQFGGEYRMEWSS